MDKKGVKGKPLTIERHGSGNRERKDVSAVINNGHSVNSRSCTNDEKHIYHQKKLERLGHSKWRQNMNVDGERYGNEIDMFNSDIEAILSPFKQMENSDSKIDRNVIKYFALLVIFLPSIIGILVPSTSESHRTNIDIANSVTDSFMVILVSWFINFMIEWPWNWHNKINQAKRKLLASTDAFVKRASTTDEVNRRILMKKILAIRKLSKYENYSLLLCFVYTCIGAGIMRWSRNFISIEDARKRLVFSNLNIMLFLFLEIFRLLLILTEKLQKHTVDDIQEKITKDHLNDNVTRKDVIGQFLRPSSSNEETNKFSGIMNGLGNLVNAVKLNSYDEGNLHYQQHFEVLQEKVNKQGEIIENLLISLATEYSKINVSLSKLEDSVNQINHRKPDEIGNQPSIFLKPFPLNLSSENKSAQSSYRPLSLPSQLNSNKPPMHTIFEETDTDNESGEDDQDIEDKSIELEKEEEEEVLKKSDDDDINISGEYDLLRDVVDNKGIRPENMMKQNKLQKINSHSTNVSSNNESIFEKSLLSRINIKDADLENFSEYNSNYFEDNQLEKCKTLGSGHFSLHGLPFSSSIRNLVTRNLVNDEGIIHDEAQDYKIDELVGYEYGSEQVSIRNSIEEKNPNLLYKLKLMMKAILENFSLVDLIMNPLATKRILYAEVIPILTTSGKEQLESYVKVTKILRSLLLDLSTKHLFLSSERSELIIIKYLNSLKRLKNLFALVYFKIPFNILRFYLSVISFFPKIFYHLFIAYPIISYRASDKRSSEINKNRSNEYNASEAKPILAMKQFHLSPNATKTAETNKYDGDEKDQYDLRTRKMVLNKLLQYYDLKRPPENSLFAPVRLYDEE